MNNQKEFKRLLNLSDFNLDYESLESEFIDLNKLAAKIAGTEISQLNLIDNFTQWSVSQIGTKDLLTPREKTICTYTVEGKKPVEILNLGDDDRFKNLESVKKAGAKYYFGIPLVSKEGFSIGSFCVISLKELQLSKEQKELLIIIAKEITERLELIRKVNKLEKENAKLIDASKEVAHDLRGMINGITGLGDLIGFENEGKNKKIEKYLKLLKGSSDSILEYADSILSDRIAKEESEDKTNVKKLAKKVERLYLPLAIKKGINFESNFEEDHLGKSFEVKTILQIVGNLVSNAMKFTSKNGSVHVEFKLIEKKTDAMNDAFDLEILVSDTGVGMNKDRINSILSEEKVTSKGTIGEEGYGLGLNLVQHHIKELNGRLAVDSKPEEGSTFRVIIPIN